MTRDETWIADAALVRLSGMCSAAAEHDALRTSRAGELVSGRFELDRRLGDGATAAVYRARDRYTDADVAVKIFRQADASSSARFDREASILAGLRHPGIVEYIAHGVAPSGERFLVTELVEGEGLGERIERGSLPIDATVAVLTGLAQALAIAHGRGVVHRDLTPRNVMLRGRSPSDPVILDFGLARAPKQATTITRSGTFVGTPGYVAPEQARGSRCIDARVDVFALGCVAYECLTGRPAFAGADFTAALTKILFESPTPLAELVPHVPPSLAELTTRMLAKHADERPRDALAVVEALRSTTFAARAPRSSINDVAVLTTGERRVVAIVLARDPLEAYVMARQGWSNDDGPTLTEEDADDMFAHLRAATKAFGATLEALADGSIVATFVGGGILADQALCAARCALALRAALPLSNIAVTMGRAELDGRLPIGPVIDRAARLAHSVPPGDRGGTAAIRIDELTAALLHDKATIRRDRTSIELLGTPLDAGGARTLLGKPAPFVGREVELAILRAIYDGCVGERSARAAIVTGPPGAGKTRLRVELVRAVAGSAETWTARGDALTAGSPFGIVAGALASAIGLEPGDPPALARRKLAARVARDVKTPASEGIAAFLGELLGIPFSDRQSVQLRAARQDPVLMGDRIRAAWLEWLRAACARRPVLLAIDDLQWGDLASIKLIDTALRSIDGAPFMVMALGRPEITETFPRLWADRSIHEIRLPPLTATAGTELVHRVLGPDTARAVVDFVVQHADGNPLYYEELIRAAARGRVEAVPGTLRAMVQARLDAIDPELRRVLRAASLFGDTATTASLRSLLGDRRGRNLEHDLRELVDLEVLQASGFERRDGTTSVSFRHELLRDAAYAMLTDADRRAGHLAVGRWLERCGDAEPVALAEHFERGGDAEHAVEWFLRAAAQALEGNDLRGAIARADRAVACGAAGETLGHARLIQAEAHRWCADAAARPRSLEALAALHPATPAWFSAIRHALVATAALGHRIADSELLQHFQSAFERNPASVAAVRAACGAAVISSLAGERGLARSILRRVAERSVEIVASDLTAHAALLHARAVCANADGAIEESLDLHEACAAAHAQMGNRRMVGVSRNNAGYAYLSIGCYGEAVRCLREALRIAEELDVPASIGCAKHNLGLALAFRGALDEARRLEVEAIAAFRDGDRRMEGASHMYLSAIELMAGDIEAAERNARDAIEILSGFPNVRIAAEAQLARVLLAAGCADRARDMAEQAYAALGTNDADAEATIRLSYVEALAATDEWREAHAAIAVARDRLLARAECLRRPAYRSAFFAVRIHARTLELARAWDPDPAPPMPDESSPAF